MTNKDFAALKKQIMSVINTMTDKQLDTMKMYGYMAAAIQDSRIPEMKDFVDPPLPPGVR